MLSKEGDLNHRGDVGHIISLTDGQIGTVPVDAAFLWIPYAMFTLHLNMPRWQWCRTTMGINHPNQPLSNRHAEMAHDRTVKAKNSTFDAGTPAPAIMTLIRS